MIKKFESFSDDFKSEIRDYLSDVIDSYDCELVIYTSEEFSETDIYKSGSSYFRGLLFLNTIGGTLRACEYVIHLKLKKVREFGYDEDMKSVTILSNVVSNLKTRYEVLDIINKGLDSLNLNYKFLEESEKQPIRYECYFFIYEN